MLSVVRTSLNFIGFGFAIYKTLQYLQAQASVKIMRPTTPRDFGLFMLLAGTAPLFLMMIQYYRTLKRIAGTKVNVFSNPIFLMAFAALLLGTVLLVTLTMRILLH